jgi:hypothetical protein
MLVCFPIAILAAETLHRAGSRMLTVAIAAACLAMLAVNTTTFLSGQWTG